MTLWQEIQKKSGKKVRECAKDLGIAEVTLYKYLNGSRTMPYRVQIYFLKLRGYEIDLINAEYLEERIKEEIKFKEVQK